MMIASSPGFFTQAQIDSMPRGPDTLADVLTEWEPAKVAWHALYASDPSEYLSQSAFLVTLSLSAVGASEDQCVDHVNRILDEYEKLASHRESRGCA